MSPTMHMPAPTAFTPVSDVVDRHDYGVTKTRKTASTGGGRAWSEDEEAYLVQTRLQKMPYKHIAAHLKKTELACRLHYHQLSHGANRRKRTTSVSSGSSTSGLSPTLAASVAISMHENPCSPSPPGSAGSYGPASAGVQLPSMVPGAMTTGASPRLPAILPKPTSMTLVLPGTSSSLVRGGFPTPIGVDAMQPHSAPLLPAANFVPTPTRLTTLPHSATTPNLRLDCSAGSQPTPSAHETVDMPRLQAVYAAHRNSFWSLVAADYGTDVSPAALEQAWRSSACCYHQTATPITPGGSPDERDAFYAGSKLVGQQDKTRISAILGIDANPRSPREREMVKKMEQGVSV